MARGDPGHSRKIDLVTLLGLVQGQPTRELVDQAMRLFMVTARAVRQAIADLDWDGYLRRPLEGQGRVIIVTKKGQQALTNPISWQS